MNRSELTSEGRILLTLEHGCHLYSQLKRESQLSDRWLIERLRELRRRGIVRRDSRWYKLAQDQGAHPFERALYRRTLQLPTAVASLVEAFPSIQTIILYGSTADGSCGPRSDADLIVVVKNENAQTKAKIDRHVIDLQLALHTEIDPVVVSVEDYKADVMSTEGGIIYGIVNAFEILYDRTKGVLPGLLQERAEEIRRDYVHLEEVSQWVKAR